MTGDWKPKVAWGLAQIRKRSPNIVGCSEAEVARFEDERHIKLPEAYRQFLAAAGANPGEFLRGSDLRFDELDRLQSGARALLDDARGPTLPEGAFVFCSHQGYQFLFFRLGEGADPEVRYYLEGEEQFKVVAASFSEWFVQTVHDEFPDIPAGEPADD